MSAVHAPVSYRYLATVGLLTGTLLCVRHAAVRIPEPLIKPLDTIPLQITDWRGSPGQELLPRILEALKPTSYLSRVYRHADEGLELFVAYYAQQRAGESIHTPKHCLPGGGWEILDASALPIRVGNRTIEINKYSVQQNGQRLLILYWYQSKKRIVANEYWGKLYMAKDSLTDGYSAAAIVKITMPDGSGAIAEGVAFASAVIPYVQECLSTNGGQRFANNGGQPGG